MDACYQQEGREGFAAAWFRHHGYTDAAQRVEAWWRSGARRKYGCRSRSGRQEAQQGTEREGDEALYRLVSSGWWPVTLEEAEVAQMTDTQLQALYEDCEVNPYDLDG